ncbi:MAG: hypothetical protein AB8I08_26030 [Sandaracinaceae bacterium]
MGFQAQLVALEKDRAALEARTKTDEPPTEQEWDALSRRLDAARALAQGLVDQARVASPCSARWDDMAGGPHARHCGSCDKTVYELSGLTSLEAAELLTGSQGELCVRLWRRKDGTVMTQDCGVGAKRKRRLRVVGAAAAVVLSAVGIGAAPRSAPEPPPHAAHHGGSYVTMGAVGVLPPAPWPPPPTPIEDQDADQLMDSVRDLAEDLPQPEADDADDGA